MSCVFCGVDGPLSREHVWPEWVRPYLSPEEPGTHTRTVIRAGEPEQQRTYSSGPASITVRSVCASCNNGWMSDLEVAAKPHVLRMILGKPTSLAGGVRDTVARWAVKTALVTGSRFEPSAPAAFYRNFYENGTPSKRERVWLGAFPHRAVHTSDWRPMSIYNNDESQPESSNGYQAVMSVGHLAIWAIGWSDRKPDFGPILDTYGMGLVRVWPPDPRRPTRWPPRPALTLKGLDQLAEALGGLKSK